VARKWQLSGLTDRRIDSCEPLDRSCRPGRDADASADGEAQREADARRARHRPPCSTEPTDRGVPPIRSAKVTLPGPRAIETPLTRPPYNSVRPSARDWPGVGAP
jgi:hypothetical protein